MNASALKHRIQDRLWEVVDRRDYVLSATLTGSFLERGALEGISDIDFVLILDKLDGGRFRQLVAAFEESLQPTLSQTGYELRINPTLGPLKFNDASTAVLHLMLYSRAAHIDHALVSPFTCYDWQRSPTYRKRSLADVFPVFGLQPRHFFNSRRGVGDYLKDLSSNLISYRELDCFDDGYNEVKRTKPMNQRDRHEFAYHVQRFLMQNLAKLVTRSNVCLHGEALLQAYFAVFSEGREEFAALYAQLSAIKQAGDFREPLPDLEARLRAFVASFEDQFRQQFVTEATRHLVFRHAPTAANHARNGSRVFLGRSDLNIEPIEMESFRELKAAVEEVKPRAVYSSPLKRCRQSLRALGNWLPSEEIIVDERLSEIDYGAFEGMTVTAARAAQPAIFAAWERGEDPRLPGGESSADVAERINAFVRERSASSTAPTLTCTHNVVLRCLLGQTLGVPRRDWHRLRIPHAAPIALVQTKHYGLFVDLPTSIERQVFEDFATPGKE